MAMKMNNKQIIYKIGILDKEYYHSYPNKICIPGKTGMIYIYIVDYRIGMTDLEGLIVKYPKIPNADVWDIMSTYKKTNKKKTTFHIVNGRFPRHYSRHNIFVHSFNEVQEYITKLIE